MIEGSLEVKSNFRQYGQVEKQRWEESEKWEKKKEDQRRERVRGKKMQVREKGRKVAKHCVFPMICGTGGFKSRLAKAAGAKPSGQMRDEKLHTVVARSTFPSQNGTSTPTSDHFWKLRCQKVHTAVAWSTFPSQNVQCTTPHVRTTFGRSTLNRRNGKIARRIGTRPSPLFSIFHFWRRSRTIASFLMSSTWKIEEVLQIAAFLALSSSKTEEVSQNCCVFKLADRQTDR